MKSFKAKNGVWIDVVKWHEFLDDSGVAHSLGERHNQTDGEWHEVLTINDQTFNLHANYWDCDSGWDEAVEWITKGGE
jgi:hypothetical protein